MRYHVAKHDVRLVRRTAHGPSRVCRPSDRHRRTKEPKDIGRQPTALHMEWDVMLGKLRELCNILAIRNVECDLVASVLQGNGGVGDQTFAATNPHARSKESYRQTAIGVRHACGNVSTTWQIVAMKRSVERER